MVESFIQAKNNPILQNICNVFQWIFNNKLLSFFLFLILFKIFSYLFDNRPVKFERFKTANTLKEFLEANYPIGSDGEVAYKALKSSSAKCYLVNTKTTQLYEFRNYGYVGWCEYSASLLSWPPMEHYQIIVLCDQDKKIVEFSIGKYAMELGP